MLATLIAALSLASSVTLDVPYVPQTDALCGGAAVAMVFRYWGDAHAGVQQFATLVDRRAGGIADDVLVNAVRQRGWRAIRINGSVDELRARLRDRQPVIVLIADRRAAYHYVVVTGAAGDRIVVHDPSWGPSRAIAEREFVRLWKPTNFWALVILPAIDNVGLPATDDVGRALQARQTESNMVFVSSRTSDERRDRCDTLLENAIADAQTRGLATADALLNEVRAQCPTSAGPLRELAGIRFAQRRWADAAAFARQALALDAHDDYASDVLASSLFVQDDTVGALRAWNRIGKPRVDVIRIEGLTHARYQVMADALGIEMNTILTAEMFERARRRVHELPDRATARLAFRPEADGFATVDVVVAERSTRPRGAVEWTAAAMRSAIDREVTVAWPGFTGQGELWTASWRWWDERPRVAIGFAAPRVGRLPGVWRVDASVETQTYALAPGSPTRESRTHGGLTISDWMTGSLRYTLGAGVDAWDGDRRTAFVSASIEHRLLADRVSVSASSTKWSSLARGRGFNSVSAQTRFVSSPQLQGWVFRATAGADRASDVSPFALWPGAGEGRARELLLRAHPLLAGGVINASGSSAFGRTLTYASTEAQRWLDRPSLVHVGLAGFVDVARATRGTATAPPAMHVDVGGGLRLKIPGMEGVLRIDAAHGVRDGAHALNVGWLF